MTRIEKRRAAWAAAMPEVKKLLRRFDRAAIAHCLQVVAHKEKLARKIKTLRKEAADLENKL